MTVISLSPITALPTPPLKTDPTNFASRADTFVAALPTLVTEQNAAIAGMNQIISGLDQTTPIAAYSSGKTYNFPTCVACTNGHTYRCVGTGIVGVDPQTDPGTSWVLVGMIPTPINDIINGCFDFWDYATSQVSSGYGSANRWLNLHIGSTKTTSRQAFPLGQTDVLGNPKYFCRTVVTSVAGAGNYVRQIYKIPGVHRYSGEKLYLAFAGKADTSKNIAIEVIQFFGTGGSPSPSISVTHQQVSLTATWKTNKLVFDLPSISGQTLGSNGDDYTQISLWFDAGSNFNARTSSLGQQSGTFDIANVSAAPSPMDLQPVPEAIEKLRCEQFLFLSESILLQAPSINNYFTILLPTTMRATPSGVVYSDIAMTAGKIRDVYASNVDRAATIYPGRSSVVIANPESLAAAGTVGFKLKLECEL